MNTVIEQSQEFSIKDILLKLKHYSREIVKNWKIVFIITLPIFSYSLYKAYTTPIKYKSTLTFMVNEDEGGLGAGSAAVGILGSLGLATTEYNLDKILQLSKSFRIISEALFVKAVIEGKEDFLANHFIKVYFSPDKKEYNFNFSHSDISKFKPEELQMLKRIYYIIAGGEDGTPGILSSSYEKLSGIMKMTLTTKNEEFSISMLRVIYERLGDFYVTKSIEKQRFTYKVIIDKADSLKRLLTGKEVSRANFDDKNRGLISETSKVPAIRLSRDVGMLNIMYTEAIKNAEVADFAIKSKVPFIQSIDIPLPPLKPIKVSILKTTIISLMIGLILSSVFIIIRKIIKDALEEIDENK